MSVAARRGGQFVRRLAHRLGGSPETGSAIWETIQLARHQDRPYPLDYISRLFPDFEELHGDRLYGDDPAIVAGIGRGEDGPMVVIGHQKGRDTAERTYRNFGMPGPEGYRKAMRVMALAEKMDLPVITLIDTPGAFPGSGAEERGQGGAIARSMQTMLRLRVPSIAVVIGEGSSGRRARARRHRPRDDARELDLLGDLARGRRGHPLARRRQGEGRRDRLPAHRRQLLPLGHRRRRRARARRWRAPRPRRGRPPARRVHLPRHARAAGALARRPAPPAARPLPPHRRLPRGGGRRPHGDGVRRRTPRSTANGAGPAA